ncbi:MAG: hypothetical protein KatS3mg059_0848 [Thermomicrobiales bacterium]|nr:MAG: hypothetical protein KatS3mg059_0848 [Thermomicrobiales bacterium]
MRDTKLGRQIDRILSLAHRLAADVRRGMGKRSEGKLGAFEAEAERGECETGVSHNTLNIARREPRNMLGEVQLQRGQARNSSDRSHEVAKRLSTLAPKRVETRGEAIARWRRCHVLCSCHEGPPRFPARPELTGCRKSELSNANELTPLACAAYYQSPKGPVEAPTGQGYDVTRSTRNAANERGRLAWESSPWA